MVFEWLYLLAMFALVGAYTAYSLRHEYLAIDRSQKDRLLVQTEVIDRYLTTQLLSIRNALDGIVVSLPSWMKGRDAPQQDSQQLRLLAGTTPGIKSLAILNATGQVIASNDSALLGLELFHQDAFAKIAVQPTRNLLFVSPPFRDYQNELAMVVYRYVVNNNGGFDGLVLACIDLNYINALLSSVRDAPDMNAYLAHGDGQLFMTAPEQSDLLGLDIDQSRGVLQNFIFSEKLSDVFIGESIVGVKENQITAIRTIFPAALNLNKPLVVALTRDAGSVYSSWRGEMRERLGLYFFLCALTMATLYFYQRRRLGFMWMDYRKELALRASDARLHSIFAATPDALLISNSSGLITMVNHQVERLLGYTAEELVGKPVEELVPKRFQSQHAAQRDEFNNNPSARRMCDGTPVKVRRKDGSECDVEVSLSRIETDEGLYFASALRDITDRLESKAKLLASETRLRAIIENEPDCIKIVDQDGLLCMMNPAGLAMIGADSIEQVIGFSVVDLVAPEFKDAFRILHTKVIAGLPANLKFKIIGLKGELRWMETHAVPMDDEGRPVHLAVTRDVTASQLAEENLRIAAAAFESQLGLVVTDANSVIQRINRAFSETSGYSPEDVIGQTPRILKSDLHDVHFYRSMWEAIQLSGKWEGEIWDRRKNGDVYLKWLTISTVHDENGNVSHYVGAHQDITERKKAEERIYELAFYDQLTGLPNRTLLIDRLRQSKTAAVRSGQFGALMFIDLDNFKTLNDTLGHGVGDKLLTQVATRLRSCVREGDTVARLGGDEFVIVLEGLGTDEASASINAEFVGSKILTELSHTYPLERHIHRCTASIGVTLFSAAEATIDNLMQQADLAMYRAKEAGRNGLCFFNLAMQMTALKHADMDKALRESIAKKSFLLLYQPQVSGINQVIGAEVLIRWMHPVHGIVSPADFIPLAEDTGLIIPIGQWVLETACAQLAQWSRNPSLSHLKLSVNVSARQFHQVNFVNSVKDTLTRAGAPANRLKLELTESVLITDVEDIIRKMVEIKSLGVGFALDDFGTGYSSLSYLKRLPLDELKIDQSFVRDILIDPNDATIAKMVVALSVSLGLSVIAEGVETEEQRQFVENLGCNLFQGYLISRPLRISQFLQLLSDISATPRGKSAAMSG